MRQNVNLSLHFVLNVESFKFEYILFLFFVAMDLPQASSE